MNGKILHLFRRPFPRPETATAVWRRVGLTSVFVMLFLMVFRPFGLHAIPAGTYVPFVMYGLVTASAMTLVGVVLPMVFPAWFDERRWTVGREIAMAALTILLIAVGNAWYSAWYFGVAVTPSFALGFVGITAAIGVFPSTAIVLAQVGRYQRQYVAAAERLDAEIVQPMPLTERAVVVITDDDGRVGVEAAADDVCCLWSADNYVEVVVKRGDVVTRHLVRTSLRFVEHRCQLPSTFWRCHRSVIVNMRRVEHVSGNAQGYSFHIGGIDSIPVARSRSREVGQRLRGQTAPTAS
jgi:hypothetical protein